MPAGFPGAAHTHGKGQETEYGCIFREFLHNFFVAANPGIMIHIPWLGHPNNGMNQQVTTNLSSSPRNQFFMGTVHGVPSLEGYDFRPTHFFKFLPEF